MLRPNELNEKTFEQVSEGMYSKSEVDAFLKEVSSSYEQVFKQNGELVRRLSLLANRVEAYRREEIKAQNADKLSENEEYNESLKNKLEQAKTFAQKMLDDAKKRADAIVEKANAESDRILVDLKDKIKHQQVELELLNSKSDSFKKKLLETYREHLLLIDAIPDEADSIVKNSPAEENEVAAVPSEKNVVLFDDEDDGKIFEDVDEFVEKLDNGEFDVDPAVVTAEETDEETADNAETELIEEAAEEIDSDSEAGEEINSFEEENQSIETEETFDSVESDSSENEEADFSSSSEDGMEDVFSGVQDETPVNEGFSFDFADISFDDEDEDDEEDDDEEDGDETIESEPDEVIEDISPVAEEAADENKLSDIFVEEDEPSEEKEDEEVTLYNFEDSADEDDDFEEDDEDETDVETESDVKSDVKSDSNGNLSGLSFKELIKAKERINDSAESEIISNDEDESNYDFFDEENEPDEDDEFAEADPDEINDESHKDNSGFKGFFRRK